MAAITICSDFGAPNNQPINAIQLRTHYKADIQWTCRLLLTVSHNSCLVSSSVTYLKILLCRQCNINMCEFNLHLGFLVNMKYPNQAPTPKGQWIRICKTLIMNPHYTG